MQPSLSIDPNKTVTEPEMSKALSNKVALITGSSRGIGRAAALALAKEGASLIGVHYASNADAAHSTVREIEALGAKAVAIEADLKKGKEAQTRSGSNLRRLRSQPRGSHGSTFSSTTQALPRHFPSRKLVSLSLTKP
jgi:short chain dehydrogenase